MLNHLKSFLSQSRLLRVSIYGLIGLLLTLLLISQVVIRFLIWPQIETRKDQFTQLISKELGIHAQIGSIKAEWELFRPSFVIENITFTQELKSNESSNPPVLEIPKISGIVSWSSVWSGTPRFYYLDSENISLTAKRDEKGSWSFAGIPVANTGGDSNLLAWVLNERNIQTQNLNVTVIDDFEGDSINHFTVENFSLKNQMNNHLINLSAYVKPTQGIFNFSGDFNHQSLSNASNWRNWKGEFHVDIRKINIANLLKITKLPIKSGSGQVEFVGNTRLENGFFQKSDAKLEAKEINVIWANDQPDLHVKNLQIGATQSLSQKVQTVNVDTLKWQFQKNSNQIHEINGLNLKITPNQEITAISKWEVTAPLLPITEIALLTQSLPLPVKIYKPLRQTQPEGVIEKLHFIWHKEKQERLFLSRQNEHVEFEILGSLKNVGWKPYGNSVPGVKGLNGEIQSTPQNGKFLLNTSDLTLESAYYFHDSKVTLPSASGEITWQQKDSQWLIGFKDILLKNSQSQIQANGSYLTNSKTNPDQLDIDVQLANMNANQLLNTIPKIIAPTTMSYLRSTISGGSLVNSSLSIHGPTTDIPFDQKSKNQFKLNLHVKNGIYRPVATDKKIKGEWPSFDKVNADISMENNLLKVDAPSGYFKNVQIKDFQVGMDVSKSPNVLEVKGNANGPLSQFLEYLVATPIGYKWQPELKKIAITGNAQLNLDLNHQFGDKENTKILAKVGLDKNQIRWGKNPPGIISKSTLELDEKGLKKADINGTFMGGPLSIKTNPTNENQIDVNADVDSALLLGLFSASQDMNDDFIARLVSGKMGIQGNVLRKVDDTALNFTLDLKSTSLNLPKPLFKAAGDTLLGFFKMNVRSSNNAQAADWQLKLGNFIESSGQLMNHQIDKVTVMIGNAAPPTSSNGVQIAVDVKTIELDRWLKLLDGFNESNPNYLERFSTKSDPQSPILPIQITGKANQLMFLNREFDQVTLEATETNSDWNAVLRAKNIDGNLFWQSKNASLPFGAIKANFKQLHIPSASNPSSSSNSSKNSLRNLPSMDINIADLNVGTMQFGETSLQAVASLTDWKLVQLSTINKSGVMTLKGNWDLPSGNQIGKTSLNVDLQTNNAGDLLSAMGLKDNVIDRGKGTVQGNLTWQGSPVDFNTLSLNGDLKLDLKNGSILQVDPGAAKLLGILSLQSLFKFATLNFQGSLGETVKSGTSFDEITMSANIRRGNIRTNDFEMKSTLARIASRGTINFNRETQDLRVTIYPRINFGSASLAAFYFVTPIIGITTMIGQYLFSSGINKALQTDLLIQGDWKNPEVIPLDQSGQPLDQETLQNIRRKSLLKEPVQNPTEKNRTLETVPTTTP